LIRKYYKQHIKSIIHYNVVKLIVNNIFRNLTHDKAAPAPVKALWRWRECGTEDIGMLHPVLPRLAPPQKTSMCSTDIVETN
jgi:hypothetical protein